MDQENKLFQLDLDLPQSMQSPGQSENLPPQLLPTCNPNHLGSQMGIPESRQVQETLWAQFRHILLRKNLFDKPKFQLCIIIYQNIHNYVGPLEPAKPIQAYLP